MKVKWPKIADKYIGKPYELGGWGKPGYDCFSVLIAMLRDSGLTIPQRSEWKGISLSNYDTLWNEDKIKAKRFVIDSLSKYLTKHTGQIQQGDILLLTCGNEGIKDAFLGIHISNRIISSIKQRGVKAFPFKYFSVHNKYKVNYDIY